MSNLKKKKKNTHALLSKTNNSKQSTLIYNPLYSTPCLDLSKTKTDVYLSYSIFDLREQSSNSGRLLRIHQC